MAGVWDLYARLGEADRSSLPDRHRRVAAVCDLRQEVNSGGFDRYFRYSGGNSAIDAMRALPELLGNDWADVLREGMKLIGAPYPEDPDERGSRIDDRNLHEALSELNERFYTLEGAADADTRLNESIADLD